AIGSEGQRESVIAEEPCCESGQQSKRYSEAKRGAEVTFGTGETRGLHPADLMLYRRREAEIEHNVVDHVIRKDDLMSVISDVVAENEVIGTIRAEVPEATHFIDATATHRHRWAESKLHALDYVRDQHAGGHFDRHTSCFEFRPETFGRDSAIETGDRANFR